MGTWAGRGLPRLLRAPRPRRTRACARSAAPAGAARSAAGSSAVRPREPVSYRLRVEREGQLLRCAEHMVAARLVRRGRGRQLGGRAGGEEAEEEEVARRGAHRVGEAHLLGRGRDPGLLAQFTGDGGAPVLAVVDEAAGQGDPAPRGLDGAGDDDGPVPSPSVTGSSATATGSGLRYAVWPQARQVRGQPASAGWAAPQAVQWPVPRDGPWEAAYEVPWEAPWEVPWESFTGRPYAITLSRRCRN